LGHLDFDIVSDLDIRISDFKLPDNSLPNMMIQPKTNNHLSIINNHCALGTLYNCREPSTNQPFIMQNEPNFGKAQMNVTKVLTKEYGNKTLGEHGKNEPNTNPIKAN